MYMDTRRQLTGLCHVTCNTGYTCMSTCCVSVWYAMTHQLALYTSTSTYTFDVFQCCTLKNQEGVVDFVM